MGATGEVSGKDAGAPSNLAAEAAALCSKNRRQPSATVGKVPVFRILRARTGFERPIHDDFALAKRASAEAHD